MRLSYCLLLWNIQPVHDEFSALTRLARDGQLRACGSCHSPVGYAADVSIVEANDPVTGRPRSIVVRGRGPALDLTIDEEMVGPEGRGLAPGQGIEHGTFVLRI